MPILIPAKNSQHRFACLALYRALLRSAREIPLPPELTFNGKHPIRAALRRQFRKNRADTSPRLVYAGLSAGYKVGKKKSGGNLVTRPRNLSKTTDFMLPPGD